ncbi:hypothetical protein [Pseudomonas jilinensis]|nr:hypothetical protein [Pseudomonas jilinensis]
MAIVYVTVTLVGLLTLVSIIGWHVAKHLDKKYGTEKDLKS